MALIDNHGRIVNYLRLAVTDRCNLRCFYCMPEEGIDYVKRSDLLSFEEMVRLVRCLAELGIEKLRLTGGEPFLRKDMMRFLTMVSKIGLKQINITTNGTLTGPLIPKLKKLGITSVNLSMDTLDEKRFKEITRRDSFKTVMSTFHQLLDEGIKTKINMVVMAGRNTEDIVPMASLAQKYPVEVRYIEEMPFNGSSNASGHTVWDHFKILDALQTVYPDITAKVMKPGATATSYEVPGFAGSLGIIAAYSRTFCGTCNRLRITPQGMIRTCLYDEGIFNIRDLMRQGATDQQLQDAVVQAVSRRAKDGFEAEKMRSNLPSESMSTIGG
ncbi:MAG: GTP 3',8-cyclase MoaA [Saprospiraceae bacterium]|nr:GTP 3',8-cyclase MoaA [Saprospiraceae bacterium]